VARMVTFPTASGDGQGLLAVPQAPGPGVLLLPNFRGLAPDTVAAAQRLARAGCPTLAVDFLHRVPLRFDDFYEQGPAALLSPDLGTLAAHINGAAAFLLRHPLVSGAHVCAFGHDGGGALALWAAAISPRVMTVSAAYPPRRRRRPGAVGARDLPACHDRQRRLSGPPAVAGRGHPPARLHRQPRAVAPSRQRHPPSPLRPPPTRRATRC